MPGIKPEGQTATHETETKLVVVKMNDRSAGQLVTHDGLNTPPLLRIMICLFKGPWQMLQFGAQRQFVAYAQKLVSTPATFILKAKELAMLESENAYGSAMASSPEEGLAAD